MKRSITFYINPSYIDMWDHDANEWGVMAQGLWETPEYGLPSKASKKIEAYVGQVLLVTDGTPGGAVLFRIPPVGGIACPQGHAQRPSKAVLAWLTSNGFAWSEAGTVPTKTCLGAYEVRTTRHFYSVERQS
jgi:hypothetical protein